MELTRSEGVSKDLIDGLNIFVWRGMEHNDNSTNQTNSTAELAQRSQLFL